MRNRIRLLLPLCQVVLAVALDTSNRRRPGTSAWEAPDRQFCDALNAPAALVRYFLVAFTDRWFPSPQTHYAVETIIYFLLVGVLWYTVSLEIGGTGRSVVTRATGIRLTTDVFAVAFGAALGFAGAEVRYQFGHPATTYSDLVSIPYFIWSVAIMVFYGRDLFLGTRGTGTEGRRRGQPGDEGDEGEEGGTKGTA